jgi:predicted  nucleic acid-binding Zn-ribbon protein
MLSSNRAGEIMKATINNLRRRADKARRLASGVSSNDSRETLLTAARDYGRQARDLEKALDKNGN